MGNPTSSPVRTALDALARTAALLSVLNRQHAPEELYANLRGVQHELGAVWDALQAVNGGAPDPWPGRPGLAAPGATEVVQPATQTRAGSQRHQVLGFFGDRGADGAADFEVIAGLDLIPSTAQARRYELVRAGWVRPVVAGADGGVGIAATRVSAKSGRPCLVWEITDVGRAALGRLNAGQMTLHIPLDTPHR